MHMVGGRVMQSVVDALLAAGSGLEGKAEVDLTKKVQGLRAALLETGPLHSDSPAQAKALWNAAVAYASLGTVNKSSMILLAACRELAFLALQHQLHRPWDDQTLVNFLEMALRIVRGYNELQDQGRVRLYLSKASEFVEELEAQVVISLGIKAQYQDALSIMFIERLRQDLMHANDDLLDHILTEALTKIEENSLPLFVSELTVVFQKSQDKKILDLLDRVHRTIRPIESFPAHISDDLIYLMIDICQCLGLKAKLEKAAGLFEQISLQTSKFYMAKLKFLLAIGSPDTEISECMVSGTQAGGSILVMAGMIEEVRGEHALDVCMQRLDQIDLRILHEDCQSEYVELRASQMIRALQMKNLSNLNLTVLKEDSRTRLQQELLSKASSVSHAQAMELLRFCLQLFSEHSARDKTNKGVVLRRYVALMLDGGRVDEAEEMLVGMPFDLHGLTLRFQLSIAMKNSQDAIRFLESAKKDPDLRMENLLEMANICSQAGQLKVLLHVLLAASDRFQVEPIPPITKLQILRSAVCTAIQYLPEGGRQEKMEMVLGMAEKAIIILMMAEEGDEDGELFAKICWNMGVEAAQNDLNKQSTLLFHCCYRFLCIGRWRSSPSLSRAKICSLTSCLSAWTQSDGPINGIPESMSSLLDEARGLLDDVEISSIYLPVPSGKRLKQTSDPKELDFLVPFDQIKMVRLLDELELKCQVINGKVSEDLVERTGTSGSVESLEQLVSWCLIHAQKKHPIDSKTMLLLLQILSQKVIESSSQSFDIQKFSFIYRGLSIFALDQPADIAMQYFRQALAIIKMYQEAYPREEVCWLAVSSYNQALRVSARSADGGRAWCELSLALCHHTGPFRQSYEQQIRSGYSKLLDRLS